MRHADTIVVGGGPAGSTCASRLVANGHDVLVLDKSPFPRLKLCAGWITEKAMADLGFTPADYPHSILKLDIRTHLPRVPFGLNWFPTPGDNYSIRRVEFDAWLLERSNAPVEIHDVKSIRREPDGFIIDDTFKCRHIVGAGGSMCPVRRSLIETKRNKSVQIATLELEFDYPQRQDICRLYFFQRGLKGYAWYVPKGGGVVNIGIGGKSKYFRKSGTNIHDHFQKFLSDLVSEGRLDKDTAASIKPTGHPYYLYTRSGPATDDRCYLIGDSAGLASLDLGEGIGPAIESGMMVADEILGQGVYDKNAVTYYTFSGLAHRMMRRFIRPK
ncbi:MAG: NAD(P)/FAD-dependent oxidoreductase [Rhizobiaceae bacterium]